MQYKTVADLNLYRSPELDSRVTQAAIGRFIEIQVDGILPPTAPLKVMLVEDLYPGWLDPQDWPKLVPAENRYYATDPSLEEIRSQLPAVMAFTQAARAVPNQYLWGGTVAPDYDCSGLMQAAFRSVGIQLPRDAYQQEAFLEPIVATIETLQPGDLIFFGTVQKATHVGLYLGYGEYIHSSGQDHGRNGIGIDRLLREAGEATRESGDSIDADVHPVSRHYFELLRGAGRVVRSYQP
jgi:cell wall-associated NlpC family hydrolase